MELLELSSDGGARGNPGPAGIGAVLRRGGTVVGTVSEYIGETTNNQAEYRALIAGLLKAKELGVRELAVFLDSKLLVEQLNLRYKVKHAALKPLFVQAWNLLKSFPKTSVTHIPREKNKTADRLVNEAIDRGVRSKE